MKRLLTTIILFIGLIPVSAMAQHGHHHGYWQRGTGPNWIWVTPAIIGGVIGYEIARNQPPVIIQQQPMIIRSPEIQQQNCSSWTEIQHSDGTITRTRTCTQ